MDLRKIKKLMELLEESGIAEIEVKEGEESIKLSRSVNTPSIPNQQIAQQPIVHQQISSPQVPVDVQSTQESPKEEKRNIAKIINALPINNLFELDSFLVSFCFLNENIFFKN